jgi:hypothetical protein
LGVERIEMNANREVLNGHFYEESILFGAILLLLISFLRFVGTRSRKRFGSHTAHGME